MATSTVPSETSDAGSSSSGSDNEQPNDDVCTGSKAALLRVLGVQVTVDRKVLYHAQWSDGAFTWTALRSTLRAVVSFHQRYQAYIAHDYAHHAPGIVFDVEPPTFLSPQKEPTTIATTPVRWFRCRHDLYTSHRFGDVEYHMFHCHPPATLSCTALQCSTCGNPYQSRKTLRKHMRLKHPDALTSKTSKRWKPTSQHSQHTTGPNST